MKFYVGQRVRILWSRGWPELAGQSGVIVGRAMDAPDLFEGNTSGEWSVAPDCYGTHLLPHPASYSGTAYFCPNSDQLEPLTDPGREVVSWSSCLWRPEHMEQTA